MNFLSTKNSRNIQTCFIFSFMVVALYFTGIMDLMAAAGKDPFATLQKAGDSGIKFLTTTVVSILGSIWIFILIIMYKQGKTDVMSIVKASLSVVAAASVTAFVEWLVSFATSA